MTFRPASGETAWQVITSACVGNMEDGYRVESYGGLYYRTRDEAWHAGCSEVGSDDFNIGEVIDGALVRLWWCNEVIDEDAAELVAIGQQVGLQPAKEA